MMPPLLAREDEAEAEEEAVVFGGVLIMDACEAAAAFLRFE